jgi:NAD(P)-dependent dehydrogenase (short-subunit alcohol dehydrogenase family)
MPRIWMITGAARGLGAQIARAALAAGDGVVATARSAADVQKQFPDAGERLLAQSLDVTSPERAVQTVNAALGRFGRIDVLVNNAGYGQLGLFEESSEQDIDRQFGTNVFGLMRVTRAVLPVMRRQKAGHIINFSSTAGVGPYALASLYGSSKFAVEGFSINLAMDVASFGIKVTIVEPGFFRTDFLDPSSVHFSGQQMDDYAGVRTEIEAQYKGVNHKQPGDPAKLGKAIVKVVQGSNPPARLLMGSDAIKFARQELQSRLAELEAWTDVSCSTDHDDAR